MNWSIRCCIPVSYCSRTLPRRWPTNPLKVLLPPRLPKTPKYRRYPSSPNWTKGSDTQSTTTILCSSLANDCLTTRSINMDSRSRCDACLGTRSVFTLDLDRTPAQLRNVGRIPYIHDRQGVGCVHQTGPTRTVRPTVSRPA